MRSKKGSHQINVNEVHYRWRATGADQVIDVTIWPTNALGPSIHACLNYHETWKPGPGYWSNVGDQIVVTNRIVRQIITYAQMERGYDPMTKGQVLALGNVDSSIQWQSAIRATRTRRK